MNIGIIVDLITHQNEVKYSSEVYTFVDTMTRNNKIVYGIDISKPHYIQEQTCQAFNFQKQGFENIKLRDFNAVYAGLAGQSLKKYGVDSSLTKNLANLFDIFERLIPYTQNGGVIQNEPNLIAKFISKSYLIDLQKTNIPTSKTIKINSLDDLIEFQKLDHPQIIKPLISERTNGTGILQNYSIEELEKLYLNYCHPSVNITTKRFYFEQGLIVQPFNFDFVNQGEVKLGIINGERTITKKSSLLSSNGTKTPIVAISGSKRRGLKIANELYHPSDEELEISMNVYQWVKEITGFNPIYLRVDMAGAKVSEIEVVNPSFNISNLQKKNQLSQQNIDKHNMLIAQGLTL